MRAFIALIGLSLLALLPTAVALAESAATTVEIGTALVCDKQTGCKEY